jgi:hypothetical protein
MVVVEICWRLVAVWSRYGEAAAAAFRSLRLVAAEAGIADCTSGRMWSSTLLKKGLM